MGERWIDEDGVVRIEADFFSDGLLWYINRVAFHPRGVALGIDPDTGKPTMQGNRDEPWSFPESVDNEKFRAVEALFDKLAP